MSSWIDDLLGKTIALAGTLLPNRKIANFIPGSGVSLTITDNTTLGATDIVINMGGVTASVTVDQNLTNADAGKSINNVGAGGEVKLNLPLNPTIGTSFEAIVADAQFMRFVANTGQTIQFDALTSASAGYIRSNYKGGSVRVKALSSTRWQAVQPVGLWRVDE